ncbi:4-hydroxybenzoate polyprenyltransferase, mitochondrial [Trichinella nelsoni]|uniref:4-hydroxybenzoate polyprenyltransferase, mitochondrial n=1 Tax=Trichinella nelsoni TaxID=6336 RepID=A0A0V0RGP4_9BILA|nr:4-hydroxybenzoate polyprenyltransferase, mitochondrial [Trichinella nelsoni]
MEFKLFQIKCRLTFNWGVLFGWAANSGSVYWLGAMTLYFSGISWTLVYDTIYAHQDKADDSIIGLKSTALKFGDNTKPYLSLFGSSMITSLAITGLMTDQTWPYYVGLLLTSCHIGWQTEEMQHLELDDAYRCNWGIWFNIFRLMRTEDIMRLAYASREINAMAQSYFKNTDHEKV